MKAPQFWHHPDHPLAVLLSPLGRAWDGLEWIHRNSARAEPAGVPVLCVGNLIAGGAGKTPVALDLGRRLLARGRKPMFLTRGHGGREQGPLRVDPARHDANAVGDEALLLARQAPCWLSRQRVPGAKMAVADGADVIVMDDGFQNPWLFKDLSLLVVDGEYGFGNGRIMPAGPLRESLSGGLARAQGVVVIGEDRTRVSDCLAAAGHQPIRATFRPGPEIAVLRERPLLAFAGIGRPEKFFDALERWGCRLAARHGFADHHAFRPEDLDRLLDAADRLNAIAVTTEKDLVRVPERFRARVRTLSITLEWADAGEAEAVLDRLLAGDGP